MIFYLVQLVLPLIVVLVLRKRAPVRSILIATLLSYVAVNLIQFLKNDRIGDVSGGDAFVLLTGGWIFPMMVSSLTLLVVRISARFK